MRALLRILLVVPLVLLGGCRLIGKILLIPVAITVVVFAGIAGIFVSESGLDDEAELYAGGLRIDERRLDVEVDDDLTFEGSLVVVTTVTSPAGLEDAQQASLDFDPRTQELELVSARVVAPDGTVVEVDEEHVFVRPSAVERGAPGFVGSMTKSVLFPQLVVGSQTHVEWRFSNDVPSALGFHYTWRPPFALPVTEARIRITYGEEAPLRWHADDAFVVETSEDGTRRTIDVALTDYAGNSPEPAMVSPRDVCPELVVSTLPSWESVGAAFHDAISERIEWTPEIDALADRIVGELEGLDAARAIHRWLGTHVQYVVVYLHPMDGWVPHFASEVLANGYGDCKDKVVLGASLLAARGIAAEPALVRLDRGFEPHALPTPLQFNHVMLYLPEYDVFSNPTDPYRDLGELEPALSDKFAVIASAEGRTTRTPTRSAEDDHYRVRHEVAISEDGVVSGRSRMSFEGRPSGRYRHRLALAGDPSLAADGLLHMDPHGGHGELETTDPSDLDVPLVCTGVWTSDVPLTVGPSIRFTTPVGIDAVNPEFVRRFLSSAERRFPILVAATTLTWDYAIELPDDYALDEVPAGNTVETNAGRFASRYSVTDSGVLEVERTLRISSDRFAAEDYGALRELLRATVSDTQTILSATRR